ncbi:MAG: hypothetical protein NC408_02520 [Candidatus Gastranaerophilales bacterium]|nr:hypothetical protein [Candidatus Gastranaerophilales bacterium]MCM1073538.1 hypothetical protein [Bacteroides sp.]
MSEIQNGYAYPSQPMMPMNKKMLKEQVQYDRQFRAPLSAPDEFARQHKKNGLIERLYNGIKNITGLGVGSKKVKAELTKLENGEITEEQAKETVDKYRKSQVNSSQAVGDLASIGASGITFFAIRNKLKMLSAEMQINKKFYDAMAEGIGQLGKEAGKGFWASLGESIIKSGQSNTKMAAVATVAAAFAGGLSKWGLLKLNRIGSKEVDKNDFNGAKTPYDKADYKYEKKLNKKERPRNFLSGMVNGLMMPLTLIGGGIVGIPAYLAGNSLNRYFVANKEDKNKSINGYVENLKSDSITHAAIATAAAIPMIKKVKYTSVYDKNLKSATEKLLNANLKQSEFEGKTTYQELKDILLDTPAIKEIVEKESGKTIEERITALTEENIFAVKFLQIDKGGQWAEALRENCPRTRDDAAVQAFLKEKLGDGYVFKKCLGVGTVAETYLVTTPEGKDVCVKALKEGITKEKILADKQKFVELINNMEGKTQQEKDYLLRNIDDLAEGIGKEVDFQNELDAAKKLVEYTKTARVVRPIEVKNGLYIMEKAEGISLDSLIKLNRFRTYLQSEERELANYKAGKLDKWEEHWAASSGRTREEFIQQRIESTENTIKHLKEDIARIEARTPDIGEIKMDDADAKYLFEEYMKVMVEQFYKVDKAGKTLHADIHPGNVFIDYNAMKQRKGQIFTLIDTGNTIDLSAQQAMNSLRFTTYIQRADVPDIVEYMLEGANLEASGLTKEEAKEKISAELKKCFFDNETALEKVNTSNLYSMVANMMKKHNIMPSSNQLNLDKARTSANESFNSLLEIWFRQQNEKINQREGVSQVGAGVAMLKDYLMLQRQFKNMQAKQEKLNLLQLSPQEAIKYRKNPNLLPTNDENYLIYKLKQKMMRYPRVSKD